MQEEFDLNHKKSSRAFDATLSLGKAARSFQSSPSENSEDMEIYLSLTEEQQRIANIMRHYRIELLLKSSKQEEIETDSNI